MNSRIERVRDIDRHRAVYKVPCSSESGCATIGELILNTEQAKQYETDVNHWYCARHNKFSDRE